MDDAYRLTDRRIWVAGQRGMVGGALARRLTREGCDLVADDHRRPDLTRQAEVEAFLAAARPEVVVLAAGRVGGIAANAARPADFLYDNLMIQANVIHACARLGVGRLLVLGSACLYPRDAPDPIREDALLSGPLEPTNEAYAIAKIAGIKLCQAYRRQHGHDFISALPTNLYGPGDNFDPQTSHVPAALLRRCHEARRAGASEVVVWGTGRPRRDFLFVEDLAEACVIVLRRYSAETPVNIGSGTDLSIRDLAEAIRRVVGFSGALRYDASKPDGAPRRRLDVSILQGLGWRPRTPLSEGLHLYYQWFLDHAAAPP